MSLNVYILALIVAICVALITNLKAKRISRSIDKEKNRLKNNGKKVKVYFEQCEIKTQENSQDNPPDSLPTKIEILDSFHNREESNLHADVSVSIIVYKYKYRNQVIQFITEGIPLPLISLRLRLDQKQYTFIYYDPENPKIYFFDIDFLVTI